MEANYFVALPLFVVILIAATTEALMLVNDKNEGWIVICNCDEGRVHYHTSSYLGGTADCEDCGGMGYTYATPSDFEDELVVTIDGVTGYAAHCDGVVILFDGEGDSLGEFDINDIERLAS